MKKIIVGISLIVVLFLMLSGCQTVSQQADLAQMQNSSITAAGLQPGEAGNSRSGSSVVSESGVKGAVQLDVPSVSGALSVNGTKLSGRDGKPVQLRGISTHGLAWFPQYVNEECWKQLRNEWNVNVMRLALYTAESGGYCTGGDQQQLKNLVRQGVQIAQKQDMYVILDWHILSDGNPNQYRAQAKAFFQEMSKEFAQANHVLYEICNEPNGATTWKEIKAYAEELIAVIRANDPDAVIIIGTPNWSQYIDQAAADPLQGSNLMYALHFYAATHKDALRNQMVQVVQKGLPVFVTEFGICDASGSGDIDVSQANQWVEQMDLHGISYVAWNLSNKNETSAILTSSCQKTSGFTQADLSHSGQWLYQMLTRSHSASVKPVASSTHNIGQTTAIGNPAAVANGGVQVTANLVNQWEQNGQPVRQYNLTLTNPTAIPVPDWAVTLQFQTPIQLSNGWNGNYAVNGQTLRITSKDYNAAIPAGGSVGDVGFIVSGGELIFS